MKTKKFDVDGIDSRYNRVPKEVSENPRYYTCLVCYYRLYNFKIEAKQEVEFLTSTPECRRKRCLLNKVELPEREKSLSASKETLLNENLLDKLEKEETRMKIDFEKMGGLIPAIVQDYRDNEVLMLGFMNQEAFDITNKTEKVTFWSRTKNKLWTKGETSGNFLIVRSLYMDCDDDTLLVKAEPKGPTCHTGNKSCFFKIIK